MKPETWNMKHKTTIMKITKRFRGCVSCLRFRISYLLLWVSFSGFYVSCLLFCVSYSLLGVSSFEFHVSCLLFSVSCFLPIVPCFMFHVSCHVSWKGGNCNKVTQPNNYRETQNMKRETWKRNMKHEPWDM